MIWIYPQKLSTELKKELKSIYVLFGNDLCILKDSQYDIIKKAKKLNFYEHINILLDIRYDWEKIFNLCRMPDLFNKKKILSLTFPKEYPVFHFNKYISLLSRYLNKKILLILRIYMSNYIKMNNSCLQCFMKTGTFVICNTPKNTELTIWIINQAQYMNLSIDRLACQLLCYYYENNLILLKQTLQLLSLMYLDGNLSVKRVSKIVTDSVYFHKKNWIEAILLGNKKRANRIFQQLEHTDANLGILLQNIQYEILVLIDIKYNLEKKVSFLTLLKQHKIYEKYHCILLFKAAKRLNMYQLYQTLELLVQEELRYKKNRNFISKTNFELLTMILCS